LFWLAQCCPAANPITQHPGSAALAAASKDSIFSYQQVFLLMRQHKPQPQLLAMNKASWMLLLLLYACE